MTNRKKTPSWLPVLILAGLGISVSPHQVLTRTSEVSRALSPVLSSYEVIRMEPGEFEQQVRTTGELRLRFNQTDFYFNLEPHDLRAPGYRAVETGPGGVTRTLPPPAGAHLQGNAGGTGRHPRPIQSDRRRGGGSCLRPRGLGLRGALAELPFRRPGWRAGGLQPCGHQARLRP